MRIVEDDFKRALLFLLLLATAVPPQLGTQAYDERHFSYDGLLSYICFSTYTSKKEWTG